MIKKAVRIAERLFFPLRCPFCDDIVASFGEKVCPTCAGKRMLVTPPFCMRCGKKLNTEDEFCGDCKEKPHSFVRGRTLYDYESVAGSLYRFKYAGRKEYADFFGEELAFYLGGFIRNINPDALIPIPLHAKRQNSRGYNQAALIADNLGKYLNIPVRTNYLVRVKNTIPLKRLNPKERQNNLKKAFNIMQDDVKLKTVIVVDDIYTTGSTIDEAAITLKAFGTEQVYFVALACGKGV